MEQLALGIAASGGEHPLIDLDFTFLIQLVLFAVMGLVTSRLLFRPFLRMKAERAAGIDGARAEAERLSAEADARLAEYEGKLAAARARAEDERRKVRTETATHEREVTEVARREAHAVLEAAHLQVVEQSEAARRDLAPRADELAHRVAAKLLGRELA